MEPVIDDFAWIDLRRRERLSALWFWEYSVEYDELEKMILELVKD